MSITRALKDQNKVIAIKKEVWASFLCIFFIPNLEQHICL